MNTGIEVYRSTCSKNIKLALSETLKDNALDLGIPQKDILSVPKSRSTIEELYRLREHVLKPHDLGGGYLVSCEKHGQRIREIASVELKRYDWEFVPAEEHDCDITTGMRETLATQLDRLILMFCRIYDRPDFYQTLKEIGPKRFYNKIMRPLLPR
jgi:hypothetical protein